jgi:hypothetical protein
MPAGPASAAWTTFEARPLSTRTASARVVMEFVSSLGSGWARLVGAGDRHPRPPVGIESGEMAGVVRTAAFERGSGPGGALRGSAGMEIPTHSATGFGCAAFSISTVHLAANSEALIDFAADSRYRGGARNGRPRKPAAIGGKSVRDLRSFHARPARHAPGGKSGRRDRIFHGLHGRERRFGSTVGEPDPVWNTMNVLGARHRRGHPSPFDSRRFRTLHSYRSSRVVAAARQAAG